MTGGNWYNIIRVKDAYEHMKKRSIQQQYVPSNYKLHIIDNQSTLVAFKLNVREEKIDEEFDDVDGFDGMGRIIEIEKRKKRKGRRRKENVGPPTSSDWEKIKLYVKFLLVFYLATLKFSDIVKLCATDDSDLHDLALGMSEKFDKYWRDFEKIDQMLMFAVVLDPRCKIGFFEYCFQNTLGYDKTLCVKNNASLNVRSQEVGRLSNKIDWDGVKMHIGNHKSLKSQFKVHMQKETKVASKLELEKYLAEASEDDSDNFDVLSWWKLNSSKYPIVSQMVQDVLAIPVSTVAYESAFSMSGRVIDPYRSSLSPKTVEALICTQQWLRKPTKISIREQLDELEQLDSVLLFGVLDFFMLWVLMAFCLEVLMAICLYMLMAF
ncbi:zinc finger BED domain-containing protein DAYSLEEPER-like [Rhododendron vialii]|uniref:zinc finger BED domain-containing protein DAYSLEEPER-like n=1 Tax=Rhododendron vialii TaxID=182163 RepID=UPI00265F4E6F|nr:zinc finger BED domain-containing protein DAYSLEEPER-like [Rhododendron vialii]